MLQNRVGLDLCVCIVVVVLFLFLLARLLEGTSKESCWKEKLKFIYCSLPSISHPVACSEWP